MKRLVIVSAVAVLFMFSVLISTGKAQDFCQGNFDYDKDVDGTDAATFKQDFGRSTFKNPCPPDGPAPVEKTGSWVNTWPLDDGFLQKGVAWPNPRFTNNNDGTITDNLTGLMWTQDATNCEGAKNWTEAMDCVFINFAFVGYAGYYDWRLPNVRELQSLIDYGMYDPALPFAHPFFNVQNNWYWSSTTVAYSTGFAWDVSMASGLVYREPMTYILYVWPVRGGH